MNTDIAQSERICDRRPRLSIGCGCLERPRGRGARGGGFDGAAVKSADACVAYAGTQSKPRSLADTLPALGSGPLLIPCHGSSKALPRCGGTGQVRVVLVAEVRSSTCDSQVATTLNVAVAASQCAATWMCHRGAYKSSSPPVFESPCVAHGGRVKTAALRVTVSRAFWPLAPHTYDQAPMSLCSRPPAPAERICEKLYALDVNGTNGNDQYVHVHPNG
eukprot:scaffold1702_cov391-Prasinococcus_capsulatus_cf.AAC.10